MAKISVTRALAQVKALNDRITRGTSTPFITSSVGGKHGTGKPLGEIEVTLRSSLQSVVDLIKQRKDLKSAIVRSNAVTLVTIGGVEMTVAEAIERKTSIEFEKALLQQLKGQLTQVNATVERANIDVQKRLEQLLQTAVGKDRQTTSAEMSSISVPFLEQNEVKAVDPSNLQSVIEKMTKEIDDFELEVDFALSEVNATTQIEVA